MFIKLYNQKKQYKITFTCFKSSNFDYLFSTKAYLVKYGQKKKKKQTILNLGSFFVIIIGRRGSIEKIEDGKNPVKIKIQVGSPT